MGYPPFGEHAPRRAPYNRTSRQSRPDSKRARPFFVAPQIPALSGVDWNSNFFHGGVHMLRRVGEGILFAASMAVFMVVFYLWAA